MLAAVLFDMGGTLDGLHWLDRFAGEYARAGVTIPWEVLRAAFDGAERRAASDEAIMSAGLDDMIDRHVGWQFEHLRTDSVATAGIDTPGLRQRVARGFAESLRADAMPSVGVLATLKSRGLQLGVVSNACGNADRLCDDLGFAPYLSLVVDSRRVGVSKPDPAIYTYAVRRLGLPPSSIMMVGDSFERDIQPARAIGMRTAWLEGPASRGCPDRSCVDLSLRTLTDLTALLALSDVDGLAAPSRTVA